MPTLTEDGSVLSWASDNDPGTLAQARQTAALPFVVKPLALMPDAHVGKGSTIGSVIATEGAIIPAAVGVDIGCGMAAFETTLTSHDLPDNLGPLLGMIRNVVPAGVGQGHEERTIDAFQVVPYTGRSDLSDKQMATARSQFGSLGSGNHFVEICLDERDVAWGVLHSGSRGIGNQLAVRHIDKAKGLMKQWFIQTEDPDLAYLPQGTKEFSDYLADLMWAQAYAKENRAHMLTQVIAALESVTRPGIVKRQVHCHHNFTSQEHHHGRNLFVTRKGAISARAGQLGIIPGSMGTRSYIVEGLGAPASFQSCSHGAGRRLSRNVARKTLSVASLQQAMEGKTWDSFHANDLLDEHPDAYKDIDQVMEDQKDLVRPLHTLSQILNYKGTK